MAAHSIRAILRDALASRVLLRMRLEDVASVVSPSVTTSELQRLGLLHLRQRPDLGEHSVGQFAVDFDQRDGAAARRLAADMEGGDVDAGLAERRGEPADEARLV